MEDKVEKALEDFIKSSESEVDVTNKKDKIAKTIVLNEREGLIERLDKQYVTSDGRILLREVY